MRSSIGSGLMLRVTGSLLTLLPTYATSRPMLPRSSMLTPAIHRSVYGTSKSGLRNENPCPLVVASPRELPTGWRNPVGNSDGGNGLSSVVMGTPMDGPVVMTFVVWQIG